MADEILWLVNGREVGRSAPVKAIATLDIPYEKGTIEAVAYKNGAECGRSSLHTVGTPAKLSVTPETIALKADNRDLCYFDITITDANGDRIPDAKTKLRCIVNGGSLLGIFSGDPANDDQYGSDTCHAYEGRAVAIVRASRPGNVRLIVLSEELASASASVKAE